MARQIFFNILGVALISTTLVSCGKNKGTELQAPSETAAGTLQDLDSYLPDPNFKNFESKVCSPLSDDFAPRDPGAGRGGLYGKLKYLKSGQPRYNKMVDYLNYGHLVAADIYLQDLFVPTRAWSKGFIDQTGVPMKNDMGQSLYEYFSLELEGRVRLGQGDTRGAYQFALLADDGAVLQIPMNDGSFQSLIDIDGTHQTKLGCSPITLYLDEETRIPIKVNYFQGPRYHIALTMMWRKVEDPNQMSEPLCGKEGNDLFFDSRTVPSTPKPAYQQLVARGWKPLSAENFSLPRWVNDNPCGELPAGDLPTIK